MKYYVFIFIAILAGCTPKKKGDEPINNEYEGNVQLDGTWESDNEIFELKEGTITYSHSLETPNHSVFKGKVVELDIDNGFAAMEIEEAKMMGGDVSAAYSGDFMCFYFEVVDDSQIKLDGPEGAVITGIENIHQNDDTERKYLVFSLK